MNPTGGKAMRRKSWWGTAGLLMAFGLVLGLARSSVAEQAVLGLDWLPYGKYAGFYAGVDKGFFSRAGIDLSLRPSKGSGEAIKQLVGGSDQFVFADMTPYVSARLQGSSILLVGMGHDKSMYTILTLEGSGLKVPKDLEGRSLGMYAGAATTKLFPAFAAFAHLDEAKIKKTFITPAAAAPSLFSGKVDAVVSASTHYPVFKAKAAALGKAIQRMDFDHYGIDIYSNGFITTQKLIAENRDLVRRFVNAIYQAWAWGIEHPEEAADIFVKHHPTQKRDLVLAQWHVANDHLLTETSKKFGIGHIADEKMKRTRDLLKTYLKLQGEAAVKDLYTNEFLPKLFPKRPVS